MKKIRIGAQLASNTEFRVSARRINDSVWVNHSRAPISTSTM